MNAALPIAIAVGSLSVGVVLAQPPPMPPPKPFSSAAYDDRLNVLDREALEMAYRNQVMHLFATWMKDSAGQPQRAVVGTNQARRAFIEAMTELDRRMKN